MNELEAIQTKLTCLNQRLERWERVCGLCQNSNADMFMARDFAVKEGITLIVLADNRKTVERRELARLLRSKKKWSAARISRVLGCCERSVERWLGMAT